MQNCHSITHFYPNYAFLIKNANYSTHFLFDFKKTAVFIFKMIVVYGCKVIVLSETSKKPPKHVKIPGT